MKKSSWLRNGKEISETTGLKMEESNGTCKLLFSNVQPDDAAVYTCQADGSDTALNSTASLLVYGGHYL